MKLGLLELAKSAKGTMAVLILAASIFGLGTGHLDGVSFAATIGTVATVFMWTRMKTDVNFNNKETK